MLTFTVREPAPEAIVETRRAPGVFLTACSELEATELDPTRPTRLVVPARVFDTYFTFRVAETRALLIEWLGADEGVVPDVARCDACSGAVGVGCTPIDARRPASVGPTGRLVLRVRAETAPVAGAMLEIR